MKEYLPAPRISQKTPFSRARSRNSVMRSSWWENWEPADAGFLMGLILPVAAVPLELALWRIDYQLWSSLDFLGELDGRWILPLLGVVLLANGFLVDRLLMRKSPQEKRLRPWMRWLHFCMAGIPFLGLYLIGFWKSMALQSLRWAFQPASKREAILLRDPSRQEGWSSFLLQCSRRLDHWVRHIEGTGWWAGWIFAVNSAFLLLISSWAAALRPIPPGRRAIAIGLTAAFHLVAFVGIRQYSVRLAKKVDSPTLRTCLKAIPIGWLMPLPGLPLILFAVLLTLEKQGLRSETLTSAAYRPRQSASRLEAWTRHNESGHGSRWWRRSPLLGGSSKQIAPGVHTQRLRIFFRAKTLMLGLDGIGLGYVSVTLARHWPPAWPWMRGVLLFGALLCSIIALLACLASLQGFVAWMRRHSEVQESNLFSSSGYLAAAASIFPIGLLAGIYLAFGQTKAAGILLGIAPALACLFGGLWMIVGSLFPHKPSGEGTLTTASWFVLAVLAQGVGLLFVLGDGIADWATFAVVAAAAMTPFGHAALASAFLGWVLLPFRFRDLHSPILPIRLSRPLWAATVAAFLPLGGLAVPWWVHFRRKNWADYQSLWAGLNQGEEAESTP